MIDTYIFKKTNRKKIGRGDIFSFLNDNSYQYGRVFSRSNSGIIAAIYNYKTSDVRLDLKFLDDDFKTHPIILDGYSLFQLKDEGDWGIILKDEKYTIPDSMKKYYFSNNNKKYIDIFQAMNIEGERLSLDPKSDNFIIVDNMIYGDYDVKYLLENYEHLKP